MTKRRLGELLRAEGLITDDQLRAALEEQRKSNMFLGEALVKLGFVSEEVIAATIVQQFNLPFIAAGQFTIAPDVLNIFPERMYFEYQFIAADKIGRTLIIVGAGLMNHDVLDELERLSGCKVCQFVSTWKEIKATIDNYAKDFKKDQSDLSSLGSMLLEEPPPTAPAKPAAAAPTGPKPIFVAKPAATPVPAAPPTATPAQAPIATPAPAAPRPMPPAPPPPGMRPAAAATPATKVGSPPPAATPAPQSPRLSALAGVKPPPAKSSNSNLVSVPAGNKTPAEANKQPGAQDASKLPPAPPGSKTGLLGLFKKN